MVVLKPLGFTSQSALPERTVELRVVALRTAGADIETSADLTPVEGERINWQILGLPPDGVALDGTLSVTGSDGVAQVNLNTGSVGGRSIQVQASVGSADPVTFTLDILQPSFELEVLSSNPLLAAIDREETVRVRLVRLFGNGAQRVPVPEETVTAELIDGPFASGARLLDGDGAQATIVTDSAGIASVTFATGTTIQSGYILRFCGNATCPGVAAADVTINVSPRGGGGAGCDDIADCNAGLACINGSCRAPQPFCSNDQDCPPGFSCIGEVCILGPDGPQCSSNADCPPGQSKSDVQPSAGMQRSAAPQISPGG
ncbi:MAG: hypothetical protein AAFY60_20930, partial [Myxococcota bacterium]